MTQESRKGFARRLRVEVFQQCNISLFSTLKTYDSEHLDCRNFNDVRVARACNRNPIYKRSNFELVFYQNPGLKKRKQLLAPNPFFFILLRAFIVTYFPVDFILAASLEREGE